MHTTVKIIAGIVAVFILLFIVSAILLINFVNPTAFKNQIDGYVFQKTNRHLTVNGNFGWSFIPWLGVDLKDIHLANPPGFEGPNLADIGEIKVHVRFWPLLQGKVALGKIIIDDATINLITNPNDQSNWAEWRKPDLGEPALTPSATTVATNTHTRFFKHFTAAGIDITHATVHLINQKTATSFSLLNFSLITTPLRDTHAFNLLAQFTYQTPTLIAETHIKSEATVDLPQQRVEFSPVTLSALLKRPGYADLSFNIKGKLRVNLRAQTLDAPFLTAQLANMKLRGHANITHLLQEPQYALTLSTDHTALQPFLTTLRKSSFIKGALSFQLAINTHGDSQKALIQNLNGVGNLAINDGAILGININQLLAQAKAIIVQKNLPDMDNTTAQTAFSHITASYTIRQGMLSNNDLKLVGGEISATGKGDVNLTNQTTNYRLNAQYQKAGKPDATPFLLPIDISGALEAPSIKPDFNVLARKILANTIKEKIQKYTGAFGKQLRLDSLFH